MGLRIPRRFGIARRGKFRYTFVRLPSVLANILHFTHVRSSNKMPGYTSMELLDMYLAYEYEECNARNVHPQLNLSIHSSSYKLFGHLHVTGVTF
ncbi:hypothetical protein NPIL_469501 [Nephila pilipes]|uniref:Uncharacterized protein n=1 Tax=Nephila pilipes TaxID=299642 RepID=A0A8X6TH76_NEPPI|nr:hypothetical protein NPIL_469501 [Nephila pilipes]